VQHRECLLHYMCVERHHLSKTTPFFSSLSPTYRCFNPTFASVDWLKKTQKHKNGNNFLLAFAPLGCKTVLFLARQCGYFKLLKSKIRGVLLWIPQWGIHDIPYAQLCVITWLEVTVTVQLGLGCITLLYSPVLTGLWHGITRATLEWTRVIPACFWLAINTE